MFRRFIFDKILTVILQFVGHGKYHLQHCRHPQVFLNGLFGQAYSYSALVIPQRVHAPLRQRQQRRGIQNRMPDGYLVPFQDAGKDFPAEREAVGDIQAAVQIPLNADSFPSKKPSIPAATI